MTFLDELVQLVPLATPRPTTTAATNVALHPTATPAAVPAAVPAATPPTTLAGAPAGARSAAAPPPAGVRHGPLIHTDGVKAQSGALPAVVHAVLGPGATLKGLAAELLPIYRGATGAQPLAADQLVKGLVVYNQDILPMSTWENHKVGLLLPLPIEIDAATGAWTLNADDVRRWSGSFVDRAGRIGAAPGRLDVLEPARIEGDARAVLGPITTAGRPAEVWKRMLRNPSREVLTFLAVMALKKASGGSRDLVLALEIVEVAKDHQLRLLATTTAGNGILRRIARALNRALPGGVTEARRTAARDRVNDALFEGPPAARQLVAHREVPENVELLDARRGSAKPTPGASADPPGGLHRLALGRDVAVGRRVVTRAGTPAVTSSGTKVDGRLELEPFLKDDASALDPPPGTADTAGRLTLLNLFGVGGGRLDAVELGGAGVLTVGLGAWSATDPDGLATLLDRLDKQAPEEFDLFFRLHRLDVGPDPANPAKPVLISIADDGVTRTPLRTPADLRTFFKAVPVRGVMTFSTEWAARFRLAALVSRPYRRQQVLMALPKLTHTAVEIAIASVDPFPPKPYDLALDGSTTLQTKVSTDTKTFLTGLPNDVLARQTFSGAVIDLAPAGLPKPTYASSHDIADDDTGEDTLNIGSMGKMAAMYAAFELRSRLGLARDAAKAAGLPVAAAGWESGFLSLVDKIWRPQIAKGFVGLDTGPKRMPVFTDMFRFAAGGTFDFTHGTATDAQIITRDLNAPLPDMEFLELIKSMIFQSNAIAAGRVINAVGYPYLNGVLREAGFFEPGPNKGSSFSGKGIWISGNYRTGGGWRTGSDGKDVDLLVLSARGKRHYKDTTNLAGNARQFARLLALAARNELFPDPANPAAAAAACAQMITIMRRHDTPPLPLPDRSFISDAIAVVATVDKAFSKIGIGVPAPPSPHQGVHDAAIIERTKGASALRYVVVALGGYQRNHFDRYHEFIRVLDRAVDAGHP